jgi:photosystem II stability/assembly factor-like uncharacterized protein
VAGAVGAVGVAGAVLWWVGSSPSAAPTAWATLGTADVHALTFDPADSDRLLFGHHDGLLATSDGGRSWDPTTLAGNDAMNVVRLNGERLQIAGHDVYLESIDGGASWSSVPNNLPGLDLHAFAVDPADPERAWAFAVGHGLFVTVNAGRDWERLDPNNWGALTAYRRGATWSDTGFAIQALALAVSPSDPNVIAAVDQQTRFYRSSDGGLTWPGPGS